MKKTLLLTIIATTQILALTAQHKMSRAEYVNRYQELAVEQMRLYKIPASITLAQGIIESGDGGSRLAVQANNHFGIKCGSNWKGATIRHDDDSKKECFRKYASVYDSYVDHSLFLKDRSRYANLFRLPLDDYRGWAYGLKEAGYATNPKYANLLIKVIEDNGLERFDKMSSSINSQLWVNMDSKGRWRGSNNGVEFVIARFGDTVIEIAYQEGITVSKVLQYNDLQEVVPLTEGVAIYLKPKKKRNKEQQHHTVQFGETLHSISQQYGIKQAELIHRNGYSKRENRVEIGTKLRLR